MLYPSLYCSSFVNSCVSVCPEDGCSLTFFGDLNSSGMSLTLLDTNSVVLDTKTF